MSKASASRRAYLLAEHWATASPLKAQRLAKGLSLAELAEAADLAPATVAKAEAGGNVADATWWALAKALGVPREFVDARFRDNVIAATGFAVLGDDG